MSHSTTTSADGTPIAFEVMGDGPLIVLVDGALCDRAGGPLRDVALALAPSMTACVYDRRGRGDSGDAAQYDVRREVEDLEAVIGTLGGRAAVFGMSSGGALALRAASSLDGIASVVVHEVPAFVHFVPESIEYRETVTAYVASGRDDEALRLFFSRVGMPPDVIDRMSASPAWHKNRALARTLAYDAAVMGDSTVADLPLDAVRAPTLATWGEFGPAFMAPTARAIAAAVNKGEARMLEGQAHAVDPRVLAAVLSDFCGT